MAAGGTTILTRRAVAFDAALLALGALLVIVLTGPLPIWMAVPVSAAAVAHVVVLGVLLGTWSRDRRTAGTPTAPSAGRAAEPFRTVRTG